MTEKRKSEKNPLLVQKQVLKQLGIGRTTFHKLRKRGKFPAPEVRSPAGYGKKWRQSHVDDFRARRDLSQHSPP